MSEKFDNFHMDLSIHHAMSSSYNPPRGHWQKKVCLPNLSSFQVLLLLHRRSFHITYERPNKHGVLSEIDDIFYFLMKGGGGFL